MNALHCKDVVTQLTTPGQIEAGLPYTYVKAEGIDNISHLRWNMFTLIHGSVSLRLITRDNIAVLSPIASKNDLAALRAFIVRLDAYVH